MVWAIAIIGGWILFSAALVGVLCMFSSRLSQAEGREEVWAPEQVTYDIRGARETAR